MISAIYERRSTRKFLTRDISKSDMTDIIQSGMKAPSSKKQTALEVYCGTGRCKRRNVKSFPSGNCKGRK